MTAELHHGNCIDILPGIPSQSVDAIITDPPYPMIKRAYGMLTVDEWWAMMMEVCEQAKRILKPTGSAVFILQPNSEHVGQMRGWPWEFMAWICREWNMVQDVYWWNTAALPLAGSNCAGLLRPSIKFCAWAGEAKCHRNQDNVLWSLNDRTVANISEARWFSGKSRTPSGIAVDHVRAHKKMLERNGVTPFNILPVSGSGGNSSRSYGNGHGARTPLKLADWWTRYICPLGGTILDPFVGSGTMGIAAIQNKCNFIGIEKFPEPGREINDKDNPDYFSIAQQCIEKVQNKIVQLSF